MARKQPPGKRPKLRQYGVYFDESARERHEVDPATGKSKATGEFAYVFTAALFRQSAKAAVEAEFLELRKEITSEIARLRPDLVGSSAWPKSGLVEIHAVDLYQSGGIYRHLKRTHPELWQRQHLWLERGLQIAASGQPTYFTYYSSSRDESSLTQYGPFSQSIGKYLKYKSVKENLDSMQRNPYFLAFPIILMILNNHLKANRGIAEMFCHTHQDAQNYSQLESFDFVRRIGHMHNLRTPVYRTCSEENLIQAADLAGYIFLQHFYATVFNTKTKPEFDQWMLRHVRPYWHVRPFEPLPGEQKMVVPLLMEFILTNAGGPPAYQAAVRETVPRVLRRMMLTGSQAPMYLTEQGMILGEPETNKPSAVAEDLYGGIIPQGAKLQGASDGEAQ